MFMQPLSPELPSKSNSEDESEFVKGSVCLCTSILGPLTKASVQGQSSKRYAGKKENYNVGMPKVHKDKQHLLRQYGRSAAWNSGKSPAGE